MAREELLMKLWEAAALLDDKQLEEAAALLAALAFPERVTPPSVADVHIVPELSHVEFVAQLSDKLRTSEEAL